VRLWPQIFINNSISNFFFSSVDGNAVKRKARQSSCTREKVLEHFMKAHSKAATRDCDIIACYISLPVGSLSDPKALATVTYLDEPALEDFLMGSGSDSAVRPDRSAHSTSSAEAQRVRVAHRAMGSCRSSWRRPARSTRSTARYGRRTPSRWRAGPTTTT